ncbi:tripartite tricarboxylate transporter substrate binding protein [Bordetella sp. BOR01]|uniref:Bug family tripartite tricarboxylate transporter substrate binding protein n=1 Tax=Bordetella sp. BOR01 TaxID=2854779 RepID=UPI001C48E92E|nr:tripartite tricarboxylate transporter substrate binding protein [Bordetella sp. BOR01]MBV7483333.1 tripartite tricarboxylate transporter substrate binding protein [Bordetella sp. BOR01]
MIPMNAAPVKSSRRMAIWCCLLAIAGFTVCAGAGAGAAADYPTKPIRMIVPFPPGATDSGARVLAQALTTSLKQPVIVENLGGANGSIGAEAVARSAPDGYTLLFTSMGTLVMNPHIYRNQRLNVERDLVPVAKVFDTPLVAEARPDRNIKSLDDLIARARDAPGKLTFASGGYGASSHMAAELFQYSTKVRMNHIPYKGNGPALMDVLGGQVDMMFDQVAASLPHIQAGELLAIAVTSSTRLPSLPDVPTVGELGHPELEMSSWASVTAPAGTPPEIVDILSRAIVRALGQPEVRKSMEASGAIAAPGDSRQLAVLLKSETERWGKVIEAAGIKAE